MGLYLFFTGFAWRYFRMWLAPAFALVIVGTLFSIQHWPGAVWLRLAGVGLFAVGYTVALSKKPAFNRLDYAKIVWAVLALAEFSIQILPTRLGFEADLAFVLGTTALTFVYMITPVKRYELAKPEQPSDVLDWDETESAR